MLQKSIEELSYILSKMDINDFECKVELVSSLVAATYKDDKKLLLVGNGGSAAEAQHMAAEYTGTLSKKNLRRGFPAISLTTDTSFLTAWSNDFGWKDIFARQIETLGRKGDILFAFSTSGTSENIIRAIQTANSHSIKTVGFTGNQGAIMLQNTDICFVVPSNATTRIQEIHTLLGHTICARVEMMLGSLP